MRKLFALLFSFSLLSFLYLPVTEVEAQACSDATVQVPDGCNPNCTQKYTPHVYTCYPIGGACYILGGSGAGITGIICDPDCTTHEQDLGNPYCSPVGGGGGGGGNCNHTYSCRKNCNANKIVGSSKCGGSCGANKVCCDDGCIPVPTPTPNPCSAPIITNVTRVSSTKVRVDWTPGANTTSQTIYIGPSKTGVQNNCLPNQSPACVVKDTSLGPARATYTTGPVLVPGKVYYIKIVNAGTCNLSSAISTYLSSCSVSPISVTMDTSSTATLTTTVSSSTDITKVHYSLSNTGIVSASPVDDTTYVYGTTLTSSNVPGTSTITSDVYFGATLACSAQGTVKTTPPGPWWQAKDADIATNGDIKSDIPDVAYKLVDDGPGGYPGIVTHGGTLTLSSGGISSKSWQANTTINTSKVYDYAYFESQIPDTTVINDASLLASNGGTISADGYYWYKYDGTVTGLPFTVSSNIAFGSRKVILLVKSADFNINGRINFADGSGFFMAIVGANSTGAKGNIVVDPTVGAGTAVLEGIYVADGSFSTGTNGGTDVRLWVRGSVAVHGIMNFNRNLVNGNTTVPAELFEYAPDQIMLFPKVLSVRKISWKEVAP